jgi:hypothetical protein
VVTKLDRLARSLPDARDIAGELTKAGVKLSIGGSVHDPEGMKVTKAKGRLRGKQPELKPAQEAHLVELWHAGHQCRARRAIFRRPLNRLPGRRPRWRTSISAGRPPMSN